MLNESAELIIKDRPNIKLFPFLQELRKQYNVQLKFNGIDKKDAYMIIDTRYDIIQVKIQRGSGKLTLL